MYDLDKMRIWGNIPIANKISGNPISTASLLRIGPTVLDGNFIKSLFTGMDFVSNSWTESFLIRKTRATPAVDFACIMRQMRGNDRLTVTVRTSGRLNARLRNASGTVQREVEITNIPTLDHDIAIYSSWDKTTLSFLAWDVTSNTLVGSGSSSVTASLVAWTEADGLYIGNRLDGTLPWTGWMYGGTFMYGTAYNLTQLQSFASKRLLTPGTYFRMIPQFYGQFGTSVIREGLGRIFDLNPTGWFSTETFWGWFLRDYDALAKYEDAQDRLVIPIAATGTGAGVFTLRLYTTVTSTAYISGIGRFYTDAAGTLGEATSMALTANALTTLYVRLASGSAYVLVDNASAIPCFGSNTHGGVHDAFTEATNAPKINGMDISYLKYCTEIRISSNLNLSVIKGSVAGLTALTYLSLYGSQLTCSGSVAGLTALTNLTISGTQLTCSGSVKELLKKLTNWYIFGSGITVYYETPDYFPATIDRYYLASAAITSSMADQIFIDLAASSVMASGSNKLLAIPSPGGAVSDASLAARTTLATAERGPFTITVHS
ncbi:MAG: hypothetical protein WCR96_03275 [Candidatus Methanomethylophilaceae archaeon]